MRSGFYYFSPAGTPFYPGVHNLGSRDWVSDDRGAEPDLGEWSGERKHYRGDPPARLPLPTLVGNEDCIRHGDSPGLPIILDRSAFCGKVLPDLCYAAEDDLLAKTNVLDCQFAKFASDVINTAYTDLPAAAAAVAVYLGPAAVVTSFDDPAPDLPDGVLAVIGTTAIVWLTGTQTFQEFALQAFYFGLGPVDQGAYSASVLYEQAALKIVARLTAAGAATATRIVLTGHSYGGAVCMTLAAKLIAANPGRNVELLTIGAPAPGDERLRDLIAALRQTHYANERDPIPYLPPGGLLFAALLPFIGPVLALLWPKFARPPRIKTLTPDGELLDEFTADRPDDLIRIAAMLIGAGLDVPHFRDHRPDWYSYYLCLACPCVPRPCVPPGMNDIAFEVQIDDFEFTFLGAPSVVNVARIALTVLTRFPSGKASAWQSAPLGAERVVIEAAIDAFDNYTDFEVKYEPAAVDPVFLCVWNFTADEMFAGIATTTFPDTFNAPNVGDGVTTLGGLFVFPTLI